MRTILFSVGFIEPRIRTILDFILFVVSGHCWIRTRTFLTSSTGRLDSWMISILLCDCTFFSFTNRLQISSVEIKTSSSFSIRADNMILKPSVSSGSRAVALSFGFLSVCTSGTIFLLFVLDSCDIVISAGVWRAGYSSGETGTLPFSTREGREEDL
uniref:Uncharacterized protein n=1 Tax=Cacopsylla melanoneura TaxID=428564 RepID=A0A8D8UWB8_9HEMI